MPTQLKHGLAKTIIAVKVRIKLTQLSLANVVLEVSYRSLSSLLRVLCNFLPVAYKSHTNKGHGSWFAGVMGHGVGVMG